MEPQTNRNLLTETSTNAEQERDIALQLANFYNVGHNRNIFHAEVLPIVKLPFSSLHTVSVLTSDIEYTCMGNDGCSEAQRKFGPVPASVFGQLSSHCSWDHAARRSQLPPTLEALLSPLHNVTPLPLKPLENTSCSKPQWFQDAGCPPHSEPHWVWGSSVWSLIQLVLWCANRSWGVSGRFFCPGYLSEEITAWLPRCCENCQNTFSNLVWWQELFQFHIISQWPFQESF